MRIIFDHLDNDALLTLYRESVDLRQQQSARGPDAAPWVRNARSARHDQIVRELNARGLLGGETADSLLRDANLAGEGTTRSTTL